MNRWLVVLDGARAGERLHLGDGPALIGRDRDAQLRLDAEKDLLVSARHAIVGRTERGWVLRDLGSRNGTWIDDVRVEGIRPLEAGDRFRLGRSGPTVLFTDRPPEELRTVDDPPPTAAGPPPLRRAGLLLAGLAGLAALTFLAVRPGWELGPVGSGSDTPSSPSGISAESDPGPSDSAVATSGARGPDSVTARLQREVAELRARVEGLDRDLDAAVAESRQLREELDEAESSGASPEEVEALERRLQSANAALRRQRMAPSLDYDEIRATAGAATAMIYVEFESGDVIAATAFGVDEGGRLVTNAHVVRRRETGDRLRRVGVQYEGATRPSPARVRAVSTTTDIALLELTDPPGETPAIRGFNAAADTLPAGTPVALLGYPLGGDPETGAEGERAPARPLLSAGILVGVRDGLLEVEGYGNVGASGSPIVDGRGEVIGVVTGGRRQGEDQRLYGVPASSILRFLAGQLPEAPRSSS